MSHADAAAHEHHAIDYIEITVTDVAEAKRFYGAAFGWAFNDYGPDDAGIRGQGREVGGFRRTRRFAGEVPSSSSIRGPWMTPWRRSGRLAVTS